MIKYSKKFPSGDYVFKCWDTDNEEVDNRLIKSIVESFTNKGESAGTVCATFKDDVMVAFTQMNTEEDYKFDMELNVKFEQYEIAYFVKKFWESRQEKSETK